MTKPSEAVLNVRVHALDFAHRNVLPETQTEDLVKRAAAFEKYLSEGASEG